MRKAGPFTIGAFSLRDPRRPGSWLSAQLALQLEGADMKHSSFRTGDEGVHERLV